MDQDAFIILTAEVLQAWEAAKTRDDALGVIVAYGTKFGYKNVLAAVQGRTPRSVDKAAAGEPA